MQKNNSKQNAIEIQYILEAYKTKNVSAFGTIGTWNSDSEQVPSANGDEPPTAPVFTKMVPCTPCTWG